MHRIDIFRVKGDNQYAVLDGFMRCRVRDFGVFGVMLLLAGVAAAQEPAHEAAMVRALGLMTLDEVVWVGASPAGLPLQAEGAQAALPVLRETVQAEDEQARLRAIEAMAKLDAHANAEQFFNSLADPSPEVREAAARTVATFDKEFVFGRVMEVLSGDAPEQYEAALPLLRGVIEARMLDVLESSEEPADRRAAAAFSLGRMGSAPAVPALAQLAWGADEWLASVAVQALLHIPDPVVIPKLAELTAHPAEQVRWSAVEGLAALGGPDAIDALGRVAVTRPADDKELSRRAVQLLAATKDPTVIPILIDAMNRNLAVRRMAVDALSGLTGQDFGDLPSVWMEWWQKRNDPAQMPQQMPQPKQLYDVEYM